jgi:hypothetical protein
VALIAGSGLLATGHGRVAAAVAEAKMNLSFEQSRSRSGWPICAAIDAAGRHGGRRWPFRSPRSAPHCARAGGDGFPARDRRAKLSTPPALNASLAGCRKSVCPAVWSMI